MVVQTMRTLVLAILLFAAGARQPFVAAIEEYCETVPSATGDRSTGGAAPRPLDRATARALRANGADGRALADLVGTSKGTSGAPAGGAAAPDRSRDRDGAVAGTGAGQAGEPSDNPLHAVTAAIESGPTLGSGFAYTLLGITALMIAAGWMRLRRS
jgi:hypothetical protein